MAEYRITNKAINDLGDIWNYAVETWSERQADLYYEMLIGFCQHIAEILLAEGVMVRLSKVCMDLLPINISYFTG